MRGRGQLSIASPDLPRSIEIACKSGDAKAVRTLVPQLAAAVGMTSGALTAWLKAQPAELV